MRDKEATREKILEAGKKAFMEKGYRGTGAGWVKTYVAIVAG